MARVAEGEPYPEPAEDDRSEAKEETKILGETGSSSVEPKEAELNSTMDTSIEEDSPEQQSRESLKEPARETSVATSASRGATGYRPARPEPKYAKII